MDPTRRGDGDGGAQAGFTLVETLVAIVVLVFGLMAVTNLMLVAASSNAVANQGTAAVTSATRALDMLKSTSYGALSAGGMTFATDHAAKDCGAVDLVVTDWHCNDDLPGVGRVHTHWWVSATADPRLFHIRVRSEGTGALTGARSRAEFTTFRACTNSDPATGGCPEAP
jgi:prepilin-type N-terminal cleavage/methylation domain-containing protein